MKIPGLLLSLIFMKPWFCLTCCKVVFFFFFHKVGVEGKMKPFRFCHHLLCKNHLIRAQGVVQWVEGLPRKYKELSLVSRPHIKKLAVTAHL